VLIKDQTQTNNISKLLLYKWYSNFILSTYQHSGACSLTV